MPPAKLYIVVMVGMTEPQLYGPYKTEEARQQDFERMYKGSTGKENSYCKLTIMDGKPNVYPFVDPD